MPGDSLTWPIDEVDDGFVTVGAATAEALAANPARANAVFVNDSTETIYLARGNAAVIGSGIRLNAAGGSYEIDAANMFRGAINAIATGAGANLTVSEGE